MDKKNITIKGIKNITLAGSPGESLMNVLNSGKDMEYSFPCGGNGRCGKCVVRVLEGNFDITAEDREIFSEEMLKRGYRLACRAVVQEDCVIEYKGAYESSYDVQSEFVEIGTENNNKNDLNREDNLKGYGIAIDIGTTTIAMSLIDIENKKSIHTITMLNRQRKFGADVIARIQASNDGKGADLKLTVERDLLTGIEKILGVTSIGADSLKEIVIAGNTTMGHLLLGYSCETLGVYPFTPVDISAKSLYFKDVFSIIGKEDESSIDRRILQDLSEVPVFFAPGISTYVGADIAAGILHCKMVEDSQVSLLIDLGTNGEMAIGNSEKLLVTSTAAGPAFEGGNISCGTGSIDGAVCDVRIIGEDIMLGTINDAPVSGICGTGVIAITSELLENEIVDETGRLEEEFFECGFVLGVAEDGRVISFTQKDVREIQLAKSAIRAGVETLILRYGIEKKDISHVYLAGGFGYHIDLEKAVKIGLLPEEFLGRIVAVGNSSLGGGVHILTNDSNRDRLDKICSMAEEISLSDDRDFQEFYMEYMMFEEDI